VRDFSAHLRLRAVSAFAPHLPIRHTPGEMPKSRTWGRGRACLAVGVANEPAFRASIEELGLAPDFATSEAEALAFLERKVYIVAFVPQQLGVATLQALVMSVGQRQPEVPVVVLGSSANLQDAVDAMRLGASDFLAPPFLSGVLEARLKKVIAEAVPNAGIDARAPSLGYLGLVGKSPAMMKLYAAIERISRYKTNVLVLGESGSGKELIARALHTCGPRRKHLFVALNCATLGREILENELFGHERGAFTGANERKKGLFELADGGTLLLDEIGELDPSTQAKLLRVLERNEFRRVGGTTKVKVDLGIIAATNRNLEEAITSKRFREDLYYRLKVLTIVVPPLRDRREDIPALIDAFIADFNRRNDGKVKGIAPPALRQLMEHDWPGNVRELKNAVESAAVMSTGDTIGPEDFENLRLNVASSPARGVIATFPLRSASATGDTIAVPAEANLADVERLLIGDRLARAPTKADAARTLGIGLRTLYTKIQTLGLERGSPATRRKRTPARLAD
jgi:DNA-binding NtrC family response regulator